MRQLCTLNHSEASRDHERLMKSRTLKRYEELFRSNRALCRQLDTAALRHSCRINLVLGRSCRPTNFARIHFGGRIYIHNIKLMSRYITPP